MSVSPSVQRMRYFWAFEPVARGLRPILGLFGLFGGFYFCLCR